ncbi:hypothetical protein M1D96_06590 [Pseudomonas sp. D1-3]
MADAPTVLVDTAPFVLVVEPQQVAGVVVASGEQGPPGPPGIGGAEISKDADNQIEQRPDGLFVPPHTWQSTDW